MNARADWGDLVKQFQSFLSGSPRNQCLGRAMLALIERLRNDPAAAGVFVAAEHFWLSLRWPESDIWIDVGYEDFSRYVVAFWKRGPAPLLQEEWGRVVVEDSEVLHTVKSFLERSRAKS